MSLGAKISIFINKIRTLRLVYLVIGDRCSRLPWLSLILLDKQARTNRKWAPKVQVA